MLKEAVVEHGYVLGCRLLMCVFCAGSCAAGEALELHRHQHGTAHWRLRLKCVVCTAGEEEEQMSHQLAVCWKTEVVLQC